MMPARRIRNRLIRHSSQNKSYKCIQIQPQIKPLIIKKSSKNKNNHSIKSNVSFSSFCYVLIGFAIYFTFMAVVLSGRSERSKDIGFGGNGKSMEKGQNLKKQLSKKQLDEIQRVRQKVKTLYAQISLQKLQAAKKMQQEITHHSSTFTSTSTSTSRSLPQLSPPIQPSPSPSPSPLPQQKPFCILIPTYNNAAQQRYKKNIDSILNQNYSNYKIFIIDDASTDNTSQLIRQHVKESQMYKEGKIIFKVNTERKMALRNILNGGMMCGETDIMVVVDGDDWLLGSEVIRGFNQVFSKEDAWVVYSNFLTVDGKIGYSRPIPQQVIDLNLHRDIPFIVSHLRAFYTKLLHKINPQDLLDQHGNYFNAANDVSIMMPILQMSGNHTRYIRQITYFYNSKTGINNHDDKKEEQIKNNQYIRRKNKYLPLKVLF